MNIDKKKLVIIGDGETAELAYEYFTSDSDYEVNAFVVEQQYLSKTSLFNIPVIPLEELKTRFSPDIYDVFVAVSYTKLNRVRKKLFYEVKCMGYKCASYISSHAFVWRGVEIGENCFIFENNVIQYKVRIGNNVTLWSGNHIGHRSIIHDNCFISSHVVVSGYCEIGKNCFLGVNSCLADNIKIAEDCFIGMGAVVNNNTEIGRIYQGSPAQPHKISVYKIFNIKQNEMD
jgi:sugar O-acyltransferase (sialic acid O-acetyltransferase NeuD family)